jgi:hypothetical protein
MAQIICEVSEGLRHSEATVRIRDYSGRAEFLPTDREFLTQRGDTYFLPVGLIHLDRAQGLALIELPLEADSGANRIWVQLKDLDLSPEAAANDPVRQGNNGSGR